MGPGLQQSQSHQSSPTYNSAQGIIIFNLGCLLPNDTTNRMSHVKQRTERTVNCQLNPTIYTMIFSRSFTTWITNTKISSALRRHYLRGTRWHHWDKTDNLATSILARHAIPREGNGLRFKKFLQSSAMFGELQKCNRQRTALIHSQNLLLCPQMYVPAVCHDRILRKGQRPG